MNGPSIIATETYLNSKLKSPEGLAVFLVELNDKAAMAKQRGWEMVFTMTRIMVHTITELLSIPHFLGRWYGDRFLIVVPGSTKRPKNAGRTGDGREFVQRYLGISIV